MLFFLFTFFVIVPIFTWLLYFRSKDGGGSEAKKFWLKVFIWGILASAVALFIELEVVQFVFPNNSDRVLNYSLAGSKKIDFNIFFFRSLLGVGEEIIKSYFLLLYIYYSKYFTKTLDGVVYGMTLALGFSLFENSMYFFKISGQESNLAQMIMPLAMRGIGPLLMHVACTGLVGLYIGRKKFSQPHKTSLFSIALMIAILIHVAYDSFLLLPKWGIAISFLTVIAVLFFLDREASKSDLKTVRETANVDSPPLEEG